MRLNELTDRAGARRERKRLGRGLGSGLGKTGGRGGKGYTARSGATVGGFEGGQMPLYRRLPKRGFHNVFRSERAIVNLGRVQAAIDAGKLDPKQPVTGDALSAAGLLRRRGSVVRLLADGEIRAAAVFEVDHASKAAVAAVEKAGGSVKILAASKPEAEAAVRKPAKKAKR